MGASLIFALSNPSLHGPPNPVALLHLVAISNHQSFQLHIVRVIARHFKTPLRYGVIDPQ